MIGRMIKTANSDPQIARRGRFIDIAFAIDRGDERRVIRVDHGKISESADAEPAFMLRAGRDAWDDFAEPVPPIGAHDILALLEGGRLDIEGDVLVLFRNLFFVKLLLEKGRGTGVTS